MALIEKRQVAVRNGNCIRCGFCTQYIACPAGTDGCIGCGACVAACPQAARNLKDVVVYDAADKAEKWNLIDFEVNGQAQQLRGPLSVSKALEQLGVLPAKDRWIGISGGEPSSHPKARPFPGYRDQCRTTIKQEVF